jgi:hypothetical protein
MALVDRAVLVNFTTHYLGIDVISVTLNAARYNNGLGWLQIFQLPFESEWLYTLQLQRFRSTLISEHMCAFHGWMCVVR